MKKYLLILGVAAVMTACSDDNNNVEKQDLPSQKIGFSTLAPKATRGENSDATKTAGLEAYHQDFVAWGYKNIINTPDVVFEGTKVSFSEDAWNYTPARYWDRSADGYDFYAAAPFTDKWVWDAAARKFSYAGFEVTGKSIAPSAAINNAAVFADDTDLMISTDITGYNDYTANKVNFIFNHILSRINIGVAKGENLADDNVNLVYVKLFNMNKNGNFNEALASGATLQDGTAARWTNATAKFTDGVGYETATPVTSAMNYVYQALCIPQVAAYAPCQLNGKDIDAATAAPYLNIKYQINDDTFNLYYNLADLFNGAGTEALSLNEGWQYTLKLTINPSLIQFDAECYEWAEKSGTPNVDID